MRLGSPLPLCQAFLVLALRRDVSSRAPEREPAFLSGGGALDDIFELCPLWFEDVLGGGEKGGPPADSS